MALYVADLYIDDSNDDTEDPTVQPGESASPDFGFIVGDVVSHGTVGYTALDALKVTLDLIEPNILSLLDPGGPTTEKLSVPDLDFGTLKDLDDAVYVNDNSYYHEDMTGSQIHGKPWYSVYKTWDLRTEELVATTTCYWWKLVYYMDEIKQYRWNNSNWVESQITPDMINYPTEKHPVDESDETLLSNAAIAETNRYTINYTTTAKVAIVWPVPTPSTAGWARIARVGVVIGTPSEHTSLAIKFKSSSGIGSGSNANITVLSSNGIPDTWADVLLFTKHSTHAPSEASITKEIVISPTLLVGTDPLFIWILLAADYVEDYENDPVGTTRFGHFWDMEIYADGVSQDVTTQSWTTGNVAKLIVSGTTPTKYRNFTVERE